MEKTTFSQSVQGNVLYYYFSNNRLTSTYIFNLFFVTENLNGNSYATCRRVCQAWLLFKNLLGGFGAAVI